MGRRPKTTRQSELDKKIGARLKLVRNKLRNENGKKVTQSQFAERYNTSEQTVRMWEKGVYTVPDEVLLDLSEFTGIDFNFLKCKSDIPNFKELAKQWDEKFPINNEDIARWEIFEDYCKLLNCDIDILYYETLDNNGETIPQKYDMLKDFHNAVNTFITENYTELKRKLRESE